MTEFKHPTLAAALVAAIGEISNPQFDATNPAFKNKYATLAGTLAAVRPVLAKHGLCITQGAEATYYENRTMAMVTSTILHEGGEMRENRIELPVFKGDAQGIGGGITYGRRYLVMAQLCIAGDDDDDGNTASGTKPAQQQAQQKPNPIPAPKEEVHFAPPEPGRPNPLMEQWVALSEKFYGEPGKASTERSRLALRVSKGRTDLSAQLTNDELITLINGMNKTIDEAKEKAKLKALEEDMAKLNNVMESELLDPVK